MLLCNCLFAVRVTGISKWSSKFSQYFYRSHIVLFAYIVYICDFGIYCWVIHSAIQPTGCTCYNNNLLTYLLYLLVCCIVFCRKMRKMCCVAFTWVREVGYTWARRRSIDQRPEWDRCHRYRRSRLAWWEMRRRCLTTSACSCCTTSASTWQTLPTKCLLPM